MYVLSTLVIFGEHKARMFDPTKRGLGIPVLLSANHQTLLCLGAHRLCECLLMCLAPHVVMTARGAPLSHLSPLIRFLVLLPTTSNTSKAIPVAQPRQPGFVSRRGGGGGPARIGHFLFLQLNPGPCVLVSTGSLLISTVKPPDLFVLIYDICRDSRPPRGF